MRALGKVVVVAKVWSFTNEYADIPYTITREGKPKREGGDGVKWGCNCPSYIYRGGPCKHLTVLFAMAREGKKTGRPCFSKHYSVTTTGLAILMGPKFGSKIQAA